MNSDYDEIIKTVIVDNASVGKTSLMEQFINSSYVPNRGHTIGVEYGSKVITINEKVIKLQIWDTAGQESFRAVTRSHYKNTKLVIFVYDIATEKVLMQ